MITIIPKIIVVKLIIYIQCDKIRGETKVSPLTPSFNNYFG